jgi:hypothetical protein
MKAKDIDLIQELITKLGICNCNILCKLTLERLLLGLSSSPHHGSHSCASLL